MRCPQVLGLVSTKFTEVLISQKSTVKIMHMSDQKPLHDYLTSGLGTLYCAVNHEILRAAAMHNWGSGLSGG